LFWLCCNSTTEAKRTSPMRNKSEAGLCLAQPTLFVDFPHGGSESRSTSRTGATTSRMPRERAFIVITRTEPCSYRRSLRTTAHLTYGCPQSPALVHMIYQWRFPSWCLCLNPRNTYPFPFRFLPQVLCIVFGGCPLHNSGVLRDAQREAGRLSLQWMD
jgi:hypothetical protein